MHYTTRVMILEHARAKKLKAQQMQPTGETRVADAATDAFVRQLLASVPRPAANPATKEAA